MEALTRPSRPPRPSAIWGSCCSTTRSERRGSCRRSVASRPRSRPPPVVPAISARRRRGPARSSTSPWAARGGATPTPPGSSSYAGGPGPTSRSSGRPHSSPVTRDRKSTRLNSSHSQISYAVFCLKKKKTQNNETYLQNSLYDKDLLDKIYTPNKSRPGLDDRPNQYENYRLDYQESPRHKYRYYAC